MKYYDYYFWENFFSIDEIKNINKISELFMNKNFIDQPAFTDKNKNLKNLKNVTAVQWKYLEESFKKLNETIIVTNRERYGYNIDSVLNSDNVLFNTYLKDNFYDWHKDASNNYYHDIKFTILINNSTENYYGGDFQIFTSGGEHTISNFNKTGTVLMFKSDIPHRVLPVNKGKRNSIAFFIRGSKFI